MAVVDVLKEKVIKRGQSLKVLDIGEPRHPAKRSRSTSRSRRASDQEQAKKVAKLIRDDGPKGVKVQVQGDELRVSSKKRDDLQDVIALVKVAGLRLRRPVHQLPLTPCWLSWGFLDMGPELRLCR